MTTNFNKEYDQFIKNGLNEDIGGGDHTSIGCISHNTTGAAQIIAKEKGIVAGVEMAEMIYNQVDKELKMVIFIYDGGGIHPGEKILEIKGDVRSILKGERFVLNCMQRMSGIATLTAKFVKEVSNTKTTILDTRKTSPGNRMMEKWAVRIGGGENHRMGLYDMILIKDNHIDYSGGIKKSLKEAKLYLEKNNLEMKIEIEVRNIDELKEVVKCNIADRVLLDNFSIAELESALAIINGKLETEASGGIDINNIGEYAKTGVDYISIGALTHSAPNIDISLLSI